MSKMVETVARAMFESEHPGSVWSPGRSSTKWWCLARAAIEAMREPTEGMIKAGCGADDFRSDVREIFTAMIDAAINEGGSPLSD